ncbi:glycoside hydrolase family 5 protein [Clostridium thermarum]|uniref:glycoside hydrolase family 5 protein n=1 Tax=Clostridium thermarum TaxID=1716543 RepID=UPI0013D3C25F|nr:glycoside hydrolase family 5 protein [Clostridium thermarum]
MRSIVSSDFLKVQGTGLVNENGEVVVLKGTNLGGWLIQESWMCPVNGIDRQWANLDSIKALKSRGFSDEIILDLYNTYQDNWITETDFDELSEMGVNCIRIPFWYRNFMKDDMGTYWNEEDMDNNPGFKRLDWAIEKAGTRGMYVILDMHGCPGGQMMDHCCGTLGKNELYDSHKYRQIMEDLWVKIAERYKDSPVVAAYDIMNEPQNNRGYKGEKSWDPDSDEAISRTISVYDQMIKAIRRVDPKHVITIEAIWTMNNLPDPRDYGWTNIMYQMHLYDTDKAKLDEKIDELYSAMINYGVAGYVGEFNNGPNEEYAMQQYNKWGISWTTWAYKGAKQEQGNNWFLWIDKKEVADVTCNSFEEIKRKWGHQVQTISFHKNSTIAGLISRYTR